MTTRTTLAFLNLAHFLDHFFLLVFPTAVLALHKAWDMTYGEALALGTPVYVAFAAGTLPAGWLADRWSREGMLATFFIGIGASSIAAGLAAGPLTLMIGLGAIGLFAAIYHPAGLAMVTEATETPGRALAMNGVWGNMGIASAALATGLVAQALGWRYAFILPGAGSVAVGLAYLMQLKGPATARTDTAGRSSLQAQAAKGDRRRVLIVIGIGALFGGLIFQGVTVALPKLFEERLTTLAGDLTQVGAAASLVFALAAFAQLPVGRLLDRVGARPIYIAAVGLQASFLALLAGAQGLQAFLYSAPLLIAMFGALPVTGWLMARYVPSKWRARAFAVEYVFSLGAGALAVPLIAHLHGQSGFGPVFLMLAGGAAIIFAAAWLLPGHKRPEPVAAPAE